MSNAIVKTQGNITVIAKPNMPYAKVSTHGLGMAKFLSQNDEADYDYQIVLHGGKTLQLTHDQALNLQTVLNQVINETNCVNEGMSPQIQVQADE